MRCFISILLLLLFANCASNDGAGDVTTVSIASCGSGVAAQSAYPINAVNEFTLTLQNTGLGDALGTALKGVASPFAFKGGVYPGTGGSCGSTIRPSESCSVILTFTPTAAGLAAVPVAVVYVTANTLSATGCIITAYSRGTPGSLDTSFGTQGIASSSFFTGDDYGADFLFSGDGSQTIVGYTFNGSDQDIAILRLVSTGLPDPAFGTAGKVVTAFGTGDDFGITPLPQSDGRFLVAGYASNGTNTDFVALRYLSNGALDTTFGTFGKIRASVGSGNDTAVGAVLDAAGRVLIAGSVAGPANADIGIIRLSTDGSLDTTFFTAGRRIYSFGTTTEFLGGITLDTDGRIVSSGWTAIGANFHGFFTRLKSDGALDTSFSSSGKFSTSFSTDSNWLGRITVDAEGRPVSVGYFLAPSSDYDLAILRLNTNGTLDTTFNSSGKVTTTIHSGNEKFASLSIETDGKILAGGTSPGASGMADIIVGRYLSNGLIDTSFGTHGFWSTDALGGGQEDCTFHIFMLPYQLAVLGCGDTVTHGYDIAALRIWR